MAEGGVAGFDAAVWFGLFVPGNTPKATIDHLNAEFVAILKAPAMGQWLREQGLQAVADTPEQARERLAADIQRWKKVIQVSGVKPE